MPPWALTGSCAEQLLCLDAGLASAHGGVGEHPSGMPGMVRTALESQAA